MAGIIHCLPGCTDLRIVFAVSVFSMMNGCASHEQLFAEYDQYFCAASDNGVPVEIEKIVEREVVRNNIVVKEVPASVTQLPWEPAVYFDSNYAKLSESAVETLSRNIRFLKKFPLYNVSIRGFTDQHASAEYNRRLSGQRTKEVVNFFAMHGIPESRLVIQAHGESFALSEKSSPAADEISRRVEMILLDQYRRPAVTYQIFSSELD